MEENYIEKVRNKSVLKGFYFRLFDDRGINAIKNCAAALYQHS